MAVESCLEPSAVVLQNYSGDKLRVVRQIKVTLSCSGHSATAIIQVQKGATAKLLVSTDLLSKLGYFFVQALEKGNSCDTLNAGVRKSDDRESKVDATVSEVTQWNDDNNCDIPSIGVHKSDSGDSKVDATVHEMVQQNNDDCDVPVIGEHKADNGKSKNDVTVPEMAQQNVNVLDIQISDD